MEKSHKIQSWKTKYFHEKFIQLLLLRTSHVKDKKYLARERWIYDSVTEQGVLIEIQDLFGPGCGTQEEPHTVILYGAAGTGKSTLARQVRGAWEEGRLYRDRFQYVFYFNCRKLTQCKVNSLEELMATDWGSTDIPIQDILSCAEQVLFILDNVDQSISNLEAHDSKHHPQRSSSHPTPPVLGHLLGPDLLFKAYFLITTRTTSLEMLTYNWEEAYWVEVLGFSESGRKDYFKNYFTDESQSVIAFSLVESNPFLLAQCLVPWVCWLVCICLKQQMEQGKIVPLTCQTTAGLFLHYISQALPVPLQQKQVSQLCSVAAEVIWQGKTLFSADELSEHGLEQDVIITFLKMGFLRENPSTLRKSLTVQFIQEFFAAVFCVLENTKFTKKYDFELPWMKIWLKLHPWHDLSRMLWFLFGLLSEQGMKEMKRIFYCHIPPRRQWILVQHIKTEILFMSQFSLNFLHCLYETQNEKLISQEMTYFEETRLCVRTERELLLVIFCVRFCDHMTWLQLNEHKLQKRERKRPGIVVSMWTPPTDASWKVLFSVLQVTGSLKELDLSGNPLSLSAVQSLCETLGQPLCQLMSLRLFGCGLTSECCQDLASALSTSSSLKELDLQQNDLGSHGVHLLCEGLRNPKCQLILLWLDLTLVSDEELEMLKQKKPQLLISSERNPDTVFPAEDLEGGEERHSTSSPKQRPQSGDLPIRILGNKGAIWGTTDPLPLKLMDERRNLRRVHFPVAGYYHWPYTGLSFVVRREVTIKIEFCAWEQFLSTNDLQNNWMVAGPLFDIKAEQGAVAAVHLPHFVALQEDNVDLSLFQVAHFKEEGMFLEKPSRVEPHYVVLQNPSFSPVGILLRMIPAARRLIPIICTTLLYHHIHSEELKFHLYLVPSDCTIQQAIDDEENKFQFKRIHKPPPTSDLYVGSRYIIFGSGELEIVPKELELCYRSPRQPQLFSEIYVGCLGSGILLEMRHKKDETVVWEALLKPGDLRPTASVLPPSYTASQHFVDKHLDQLVARVTSVDSILDKLLSEQIVSTEQYDSVRAEATKPNKMRKLFSFSPSWNLACKDKLYEALMEIHPHLIIDLWQGHGK